MRDYTYSSERGILESVETTLGENTTITEGYTIDNLGRLTNNTISLNDSLSFTYGYTYTETETTTSGQISTVTVQGTDEEGNITNSTYTYTYDGTGNITDIVKTVAGADDEEYRYSYDRQGQLIREDNSVIGRTYIYAYDNAGNLQRKDEYAYSSETGTGELLDVINYTYSDDKDWGDLLTKYDGQTITYDTIGNPLSYYNGQSYTFTWAQGRRLATATLNNVDMSFLYDDQGLRTQKVVGETTISYTWSGTTLLSEATDAYVIIYLYDESASPIGFQYKTATTTETYLYEKNLQGDIIAVYSEAGVKLISYAYDAWGNANISFHNGGETTNATKNPFTYRGYYYDQDLGLYYLQSRYYDAKVGRFISADEIAVITASPTTLTDKNLYAYCDNNPITRGDGDGEFWHVLIGAAFGFAFELGSQLIANGGDFDDLNWAKIGIATAVGGITAVCGAFSGAVVSSIGNVVMEAITQREEGTKDYQKLAVAGFVGFFSSLAGSVAGNITKRIGGKLVIDKLSTQPSSVIKKTVLSVLDVPGIHRNSVKNLSWAVAKYSDLPYKLLGKSIPQIFNSLTVGFSGYGTMGVIYGFR